MPTSLTELAATIAAAQASQSMMTSQEIREVLQTAYETLAKIKASEEAQDSIGQEASTPVEDNLAQLRANPLRSISKNKIICLECGAELTVLSANHLSSHGLTAKEYRKKWGLPAKQGLASKAFSQQKREKAKELGLGNNLAEYRKRAFKKDEVKKEEPVPVVKRKTNQPRVMDASSTNGVQESDLDKVLEVMRQFNEGVSVNGLARSTGFSVPNIKKILAQALDAGKVKRVSGEKLMLGYKLV